MPLRTQGKASRSSRARGMTRAIAQALFVSASEALQSCRGRTGRAPRVLRQLHQLLLSPASHVHIAAWRPRPAQHPAQGLLLPLTHGGQLQDDCLLAAHQVGGKHDGARIAPAAVCVRGGARRHGADIECPAHMRYSRAPARPCSGLCVVWERLGAGGAYEARSTTMQWAVTASTGAYLI